MLLKRGANLSIRFHDGRRADQVLWEFLNTLKHLQFCPLNSAQLSEIKDLIYETFHKYAFHELISIAAKLKNTIDQLYSLELMMLSHPYQFVDDWSEKANRHRQTFSPNLLFYSRSSTYHRLSSFRNEILKDMKQFGEALNSCGQQIPSLSPSDIHTLSELIHFFTRKEEFDKATPEVWSSHQQTINSIIDRIIESKKSSDACQNLVPSAFFGFRKAKNHPKLQLMHAYKCSNKEVLTKEQLILVNAVKTYFRDRNETQLTQSQIKIIDYLKSEASLQDLGITPENARKYLMETKLIDMALAELNKSSLTKISFPNSTYKIRKKILKSGSPYMTTAEAYTKTLDPRKIKDKNYLKIPSHWIPERTGQFAKIVGNQLILAAALSKRLNHYVPSVWAIRGNTGSGKSYTIAHDPSFKYGLDDNNEISGHLNPDIFKYFLKRKHPLNSLAYVSNQQVHDEGAAIFRLFQEAIKNEAKNSSTFIDARLSTIVDIENTLINPAKEQNKEALLIDLETPLSFSLLRVLTRDPFGKDPCPPLLDIIKGYKDSILYRKNLLNKVAKDPSLQYFKLYCQDKDGSRHLVAEKRQDMFKVHSEEILQKCLQLPSEEDIDKVLTQKISFEAINIAIQNKVIPEQYRSSLEPWNGIPLGKAVEMHIMGVQPANALALLLDEAAYAKKYGNVTIHLFSGKWLSDFPQLISHLHSEHLLHVRGIDDEGNGLHWPSQKFEWKLNPKFNPESKALGSTKGGFQMKLGYFILPAAMSKRLLANSLSPKILQEMEIRTEAGALLGYRFFVHPEGYTHYKILHDMNIPFVKPEQSEYLGTPTSSYRSWVIRKVINRSDDSLPAPESIPFIIKLGVSGTKSHTDKLLTEEMIQNSLRAQGLFESVKATSQKHEPVLPYLHLFPETLGLTLANIPGYPPCSPCDAEPKSSGLLVREIPKELLEGRGKIYSFSALMSIERLTLFQEKHNSLNENDPLTHRLPLIFEVINACIKKGQVKTPVEFMEKYLIQGFLKAIEPVMFEKKLALSLHAQNLCLILNAENIPSAFAYRDFEGVNNQGIGFVESYSWFYRYHIFIKLLNVITQSESAMTPVPPGAPTQIGHEQPLTERNLNDYLFHQIQNPETLTKLKQLSLTPEQASLLLHKLDDFYMHLLRSHFDLKEAKEFMQDGYLPAAESGSTGEPSLLAFNEALWKTSWKLNY